MKFCNVQNFFGRFKNNISILLFTSSTNFFTYMASSCKYCGVTGGQAVTSKCFPREIENQQHHEFVVAILAPPLQSGKLSHRAVFRIGFSISDSFSCRYPNSQFT